ncbi:MAG: late competence development ComFB family protein [Candidatus Omnitrophica bacterium]|nr:late competence development ComFB family protein [Candidatus Omnitrophota bacterium]
MALTEKNQKSAPLVNYMEQLAGNVLSRLILEYKDADFSRGAVEDIKALALNRLWPMYTTTPRGRDFLKKIVDEDRVEKDVARELRAAIDIVRSNPRR